MADANGLRFWLRSRSEDWIPVAAVEGEPPPAYDPLRRTYALGRYAPIHFTETPDDAETRRQLPRMVTDNHGTFAFFDSTSGQVFASGSATSAVAIHTPSVPPADMTVGGDGVLHVIEADRVVLVDLRDRWDSVPLSATGFTPARMASTRATGVWVLDSATRRLAQVKGAPLRRRGLRLRAPDVFSPDEENPAPPRLAVLRTQFAASETPIDIAAAEDGQLAVLLWRGSSEALVRFVDPLGAISSAHTLAGVSRPYALGFVDANTLAVLVAALHKPDPDGPGVPGGAEVVTYLAEHSARDTTRPPLGGVYPLPGHDLAGFVRGVSAPLRYALTQQADTPLVPPRKLTRVPANFRTTAGALELDPEDPLDSGKVGFVWHRAYLEAHFPPSCGARLFVAASDVNEPPDDFFEHVFGEIDALSSRPRGVWSTHPSELPFHPGLLPCTPEPHRSGLFSVLLQRSGRRVSAVSGRYLWLRLRLEGNGHSTPEIAALRIYGSRFSYVQRYLPRIYHEQLFPPEADLLVSQGGLSSADFLERFLCNFEGVLTPIEDRVANAHLLTDPSTVPEDSLDWLGSWIGFVFDSAYPRAHRREALRQAMLLNRLRGTARGLELAIDILSGGRLIDGEMHGGAVNTGKAVILEGWRLRRSFATLLGVDLSHADDPLLVGVTRSGNSRVGDSLILSQQHRYEFFALLKRSFPGDGPPAGATMDEWISWHLEQLIDRFAVEPFLDELAYRLIVLVHEDLGTDLVGLIERVAALEAPAHLETEVHRATHPFMVGLASLVGVDTYLRAPERKPDIVVDESTLGARGFLQRPASLDPRLEGGRP